MLDDAAGGRACIVDQDVDATERRVRLLHEVLGIRRLGEVGDDGNDLASRFLGDFGCGFLERSLMARADRDFHAFAR